MGSYIEFPCIRCMGPGEFSCLVILDVLGKSNPTLHKIHLFLNMDKIVDEVCDALQLL